MSTLAPPPRALTTIPREKYDVVIVGTGAGGAALGYALRESGKRILLIERGDVLPQEPQNWSAAAVFTEHRYKAGELWEDSSGRAFHPGVNYWVGGNTKVYGAALPRYRKSDFEEVAHADARSPAWPFTYRDLEPHYNRAEELFFVHGADDDPTLRRSHPYPHPEVDHEPFIAGIAARIVDAGYTPSHVPLGIDLASNGTCVRCPTCDGFPCRLHAKADAELCCVRPALKHEGVDLLTRAYVRQVVTDERGVRAVGVDTEHKGERAQVSGRVVVVACGAVNSAALLLRSASERHPGGLANRSGTVGRNYMVHNNSVMVMLAPRRRNPVVFQKTLYVNDFYLAGNDEHAFPLGTMQLIGKLQGQMMSSQGRFIPSPVLRWVAARSVDWWLFSEDLPDPENRVTLGSSGRIRVTWRPNNVAAHRALVREARRMARGAGFPVVFTQSAGIEVNSHQAGTVRAGKDPATSALDPDCRSHEMENLFVVDSSFFPSLPVMNPALTIAANALRVAPHVLAAAV
jgi:choline dehydrogenase-like flavoprotein